MPDEFLTHTLMLPAGAAGRRLDQALAEALPQYSRARLQRWIEQGAVALDGATCTLTRTRLQGGESVRLHALVPLAVPLAPEALPLQIVYEDDALIVLNKPAGLVVHPGAGNAAHTLQNALLSHDPTLTRVPRAGLVHRLDKDTSGLMLVARTLDAHTALAAAIASRAIRREYLAFVLGLPTAGGTVDEPIGRHRTQRTRMAVRADGREAVTHYRVQERFRGHALLAVKLQTGRTHQIRVHLAHAGYPIVGDPVYGSRRRLIARATPALLAALGGLRRQALHAFRLAFEHPLDGRTLSFEVPPPADLKALLGALRADARAAAKA